MKKIAAAILLACGAAYGATNWVAVAVTEDGEAQFVVDNSSIRGPYEAVSVTVRSVTTKPEIVEASWVIDCDSKTAVVSFFQYRTVHGELTNLVPGPMKVPETSPDSVAHIIMDHVCDRYKKI